MYVSRFENVWSDSYIAGSHAFPWKLKSGYVFVSSIGKKYVAEGVKADLKT